MSKFGLMDEDPAPQPEAPATAPLSDRLTQFRKVERRPFVDIKAADAAAAVHGFVSREAIPARMRRRRAPVMEPTRHLAIRLTESQYNRFVAYADRHKLTYHDALSHLLDETGS